MKVQYSILLLLSLTLCYSSSIYAQDVYFPEIESGEWETISFDELDWCQEHVDDLITLNEEGNSKALIILKGGKIALEAYFGDHDATKNWYWASAGKTLTASLVGVAQEEGRLDINDFSSAYLGDWTACVEGNENITIRNQLTMTTGLDYNFDVDCTDADCLTCLNDVGTEWFYHNAPYTILRDVIEIATGVSYLEYTQQSITERIGMNGFWLPVGDNNVYFSTARSMARFGLMMQAGGDWNGEEIIADKTYYNAMITPSQDINQSYGYLWWLNGQESYRLPGTTITFPGSLIPQAPNDMYMAIGKNGQYIIVIPSEDVVIIRMGDNPDESLVPINFLKDLIDLYNKLECTNDVVESNFDQIEIVNRISYNKLNIRGLHNGCKYSITNHDGSIVQRGTVNNSEIDISNINRNLYFITFYDGLEMTTRRFFKG